MRITSTKERDVTHVKALIFGDSGIGKTTMLGTLPEKGGEVMIASAERGLLPLRHMDYPVLVIEEWTDVREMVNEFNDGTYGGCKVLAIDSLSELSELCKRHIVTVDRRALIGERTKGKRETPAGVYDDLMQLEDWGLYRSRMASMINAIVHLPMHVIFTCLSQWVEDKRSGEIMKTPALNGKLANECPAWFDLVLHMEDAKDEEGGTVRVIRTMHSDNIVAKDASGVLDMYEATDWVTIFNKILGKAKAKAGKGGK